VRSDTRMILHDDGGGLPAIHRRNQGSSRSPMFSDRVCAINA
jgi:hypothetical protein